MSNEVHQSVIDVFQNHWIVEIIAVLSFLLFYEIIVKRTFEFSVNKWKARLFKVTGKYIAYYQDQNEGNQIRRYSDLDIRQRGNRIEGTNISVDPSDSSTRIWRLEGELFHGHLIAGVYREVSHRDSRSVGTFFLAQEGSMDFNGYWSGWDEENHKLSIGEYRFNKRPSKLFFSNFKPENRHQVAFLCEKAFGHRYFEVGIEPKLDAIHQGKLIIVKHEKRGPVVGFSLSYMLPKLKLLEFINNSSGPSTVIDRRLENTIADDILASDKEGKLGIIQTICVSDENRNRGVGKDLFEFTERELKKLLPSVIISPAWNVNGQMNASKIMESFGYSEALNIKGYWKVACDKKKFSCPSRVNDVCACAMSLFKKSL